MPVILGGNTGIYLASLTPSVDPDAQAFITAAAITDPTQQAAINTLVVDLKGYNVWSKMKALYPMVGGTATSMKWNLKDPRDLNAAYRLLFIGGGTWDANGYTPNGSNGYANTNFNPTTEFTVDNNVHLSYYSRTNVNTTQVEIGSAIAVSGPYLMLEIRTAGTTYFIMNRTTSFATISDADSRAFYMGNRIGTSEKGFKNNSNVVSLTNSSLTRPNFNVYLGALNAANIANFYSTKQCAFSSIGDGLTDTEAANFYTAVQTFQTTLGRSIGTQTVSDADAQAFVTNAGIVDQVEANAVNNLVIGMKADGTWSKMKAIYPMVGGTNAQHSWNLKNTAQFQISWQGGVTSSANGVQFNNINSYGITGLIPSSALTLNSTHISFYSRTTGNVGVDDFGAYNGVNQAMRVIIKDSGTSNHILDMNSTSQRVTGTVADSTGFFLCNRETTTALRSLRNNVSLGSNTNTNTGTLPSVAMYLGGLNNAGSFANPSGRQCAFASVGDGLTTTDQTNLYNRVQTFNTALARQV